MNRLVTPSSREQEMSASLRDAVLLEISTRGLSNGELSQIFGLLPVGVEMLLLEEEWPIDIAIRAASALGIEIEINAYARH